MSIVLSTRPHEVMPHGAKVTAYEMGFSFTDRPTATQVVEALTGFEPPVYARAVEDGMPGPRGVWRRDNGVSMVLGTTANGLDLASAEEHLREAAMAVDEAVMGPDGVARAVHWLEFHLGSTANVPTLPALDRS